MTKIEEIILFVVFLKYYIAGSISSGTVDVYYQTNERLFAIIDDLFISLKINNDLIKTKTAEEYLSSHSYIQEALCNNHKKYKQIHDISKTKISHKTAYYISKINEVIEEMIRKRTIKNDENRNDSSTYAAVDESLKHYLKLGRAFKLKIKTFTPNVPNLSGLRSHSSEDARRIFEGNSTGIKRYPFMVSVHVASRFICAGSLVHESLAISAASCLIETEDISQPPIQIRVGSDFVSKKGSLVNISEVIFHPEFDRSTLANNLVLLRTRRALRFRPQRVVAIQYDREGVRPSGETTDIIILGWGRRRIDENDLPQELRPLSESRLELYNLEACKYIYTRAYVTDKTFCAGFKDRGAGACNHDGGGPALAANVLMGVISFGSPRCGTADVPTVFTRLSLYADWIDEVFENLAKTPDDQPLEPQQHPFTPVQPTDMQDVYRQNLNVESILYGPIDIADGDYIDLFNESTKQQLRELGDNPSMSDPRIFANLKPKTSKPTLPPEGFWRDASMEQSETSTAKVEPTLTLLEEIVDSDSESAFEIIEIAIPNTTETNQEEPFYGVGSTEVETVQSISDDSKERIEKSTQGNAVYKYYQATKTNSQPVTYKQFTQIFSPELIEENDKSNKLKKSSLTKIEETKENVHVEQNKFGKTIEHDKAVIIMFDSGTTKRLEVDRRDPVYERGFKILAAKLDKRGPLNNVGAESV